MVAVKNQEHNSRQQSIQPGTIPVIGIAGGSGSGKTTLLRALATFSTQPLTILPLDAYYRDLSHVPIGERKLVNFDHPDALDSALCAMHLERLSLGQAIECPVYDFATHSRLGCKTVKPESLIVCEGTLVLSISAIRDHLDYSVFVETADDIRLIRRIKRDQLERGRSIDSILDQYITTVRPMYEQFILPCKTWCDLIVDGTEKPEIIAEHVLNSYAYHAREERGSRRTGVIESN